MVDIPCAFACKFATARIPICWDAVGDASDAAAAAAVVADAAAAPAATAAAAATTATAVSAVTATAADSGSYPVDITSVDDQTTKTS